MTDDDLIAVEFSRSWSYWLFVYSIGLTPVLIGARFYVRTRRRGAVAKSDNASAMELAAALIALLALRQVFVPAEISGLTRLDLLLESSCFPCAA
ncbi:hypothetical protein OHS18_20300 [Amycolatopsis sp. NBC_00355]|uniref:hypothetical protein n=1 Tax=Amycolatopsis sp. NBC_00355 TaxID=2975957 RepID=UPI002E26EB0A